MGQSDQASGGEIRRNPVNGKLSIVAPARATRPHDAAAERGAKRADIPPATPSEPLTTAAGCPFCEGHESLTPPEVDAFRPGGGAADAPGWTVRVVPNKYPALPGRHEVIIHSPRHDAELEDLSEDELVAALEMWRRRIAWQFEDGAAAATVIVNRGAAAGASQPHPHAQLFATPIVPPLQLDELAEFDRFRNRYGGCVLCTEMENAGARLVQDGDVAAWVPAALRYSHELWLAPQEHQPDVREADLRPLARTLRRALAALDAATRGAPLNFWLHTAPAELHGTYHWHVELAPRLSMLAGFELGTDIALVAADPEVDAARLREVWPQD